MVLPLLFISSLSFIDKFRKCAWHSITSLIDHAIQIIVGQKDKGSQWSVVDLAEFLYTALLYQAMTNRNKYKRCNFT